MVGIIRKIMPENNMDFEDILSFETENFFGIYDHSYDEFVLIAKEDNELSTTRIDYVSDLDDLDSQVFAACEEHIIGVSNHNAYKIILTKE